MHTHRTALAAPLLLPCILLAAPAHEWRADLATREVANLYPRHGETAAIRCTLTRAGAPYVPESVSASVSTNGVWGDGWPAPATFASNVVVVSWSPELDPGAETLCLRLEIDGVHRPSAILHLGPGGGGSTLPPPGTVIDFAETRYVNEPWASRSELRDATNALVIAAVDLAPYATWQGLDSATNALRQGVDDALGGYAAYGEDGDLEASAYTVPWGYGGYIRFAGETVHFRHPGMHGFPGTDALVRIPYTNFATNTLATETGVADAIAAATNGLLSAETELEAIRAAADGIELPEDPTAAELGAAFRELLLCIRNPVRARALRARPAPDQEPAP